MGQLANRSCAWNEFRGLEAVKKCKTVYLEAYTSILLVSKEKLVSLQLPDNMQIC